MLFKDFINIVIGGNCKLFQGTSNEVFSPH